MTGYVLILFLRLLITVYSETFYLDLSPKNPAAPRGSLENPYTDIESAFVDSTHFETINLVFINRSNMGQQTYIISKSWKFESKNVSLVGQGSKSVKVKFMLDASSLIFENCAVSIANLSMEIQSFLAIKTLSCNFINLEKINISLTTPTFSFASIENVLSVNITDITVMNSSLRSAAFLFKISAPKNLTVMGFFITDSNFSEESKAISVEKGQLVLISELSAIRCNFTSSHFISITDSSLLLLYDFTLNSNSLSNGSNLLQVKGSETDISLKKAIFRMNKGGLILENSLKMETEVLVVVKAKKAELLSITCDQNILFYTLISLSEIQTSTSFQNNLFVQNMAANQLMIIDNQQIIMKSNVFTNSNNLVNPYKGLYAYFEANPFGTAVSISEFKTLFITGFTVSNSLSFSTLSGLSLVSKSKINMGDIVINGFVCENNNVFHVSSLFTFSSNCLEIDLENKVTLKDFKVLSNQIKVLDTNSDNGGNNCLKTVNENIEILIDSSVFLGNRASAESVCIKTIGKLFSITNSIFEDNKNPEIPMLSRNDAGALHLGSKDIFISNTIIKNCSAYSGAAINLHNLVDNPSQNVLIDNTTITLNTGESTSAIQFHSSIDLLQFRMSNSVIKENLVNFHAIVATFFSGVSGNSLVFFKVAIEKNLGKGIGCCFFLASIFCDIVFEESKFISNALVDIPFLGGTVFLVYGGDREFFVSSKNCFFKNNTCVSRGPTVLVQYGRYSDSNSIFDENYAPTAGSLSFEVTTIASLFNTTIKGKLTKNTGAIYLTNSAKLQIDKSRFVNCAAESGGGVFTALGSLVSIIIRNTEFETNTGLKDGAIIDAAISFAHQITIFNCSFRNNSGARSLFTGINAEFYIENSNFESNPCPLFEIRQSTVNIIGTNINTFQSRMQDPTGPGEVLFKLTANSNLKISSSVIDNRKIKQSPSLIKSEDSTISFTKTEIKYIFSPRVSVLITCYSSVLNITNSTMFELYTGFLHAETSEVSFHELLLSDSLSEEFNFITLNNMKVVNYSNTQISNCKSPKARGAVAIQASSPTSQLILITNSKFLHMESATGGAIFVSDVDIRIQNSTFSENLASSTDGGAIHFSCSSVTFTCKWAISNSWFESNKAELGGGAMKYTGRLPILVKDCIFRGNIARFGADFLSFPSNFLFKAGYENADNANFTNCQLELSSCKIPSAVSGQQMMEIWFQVRDTFNQIYHDDALRARIEISVNNGSGIPNFLQGTTSIPANNGTFKFQGLTAIAKPGSVNYFYFHFNTPFISEYMKGGNEFLRLDDSSGGTVATIESDFRKCIKGEIEITTTNICYLCLEGTFSLNVMDQGCSKCLKNAKCFGGSRLEVERGHWRKDTESVHIYNCEETPFSCVGGFEDICAQGYRGILCSECESGGDNGKTPFFKKNTFECESCDTWRVYFAMLVIFLFFFLVAIVLLIHRQDEKTAAPPSIGKILSTHLQFAYQATTQGSSMPESVKTLTSNVSTTISMEGLFNVLSCMKIYLPVSTYLLNLLVTLFSMFVIILFLLIIWGFIGLKRKSSLRFIKVKVVSSIVVITYFLHSRYVNFFVTNLSCREYEGELFLVENLGQKCWSGEHMVYSLVITLPMVIFWMILLPGIVFYLILKNRRAKAPRFQHVVRYFNVGFKENLFYWEFVLLLEKYLIILIPLFINNPNSQPKMVLYALLMLLFLIIHVEVKPYSVKAINILQFLSFYACFISYLSSIGRSTISSDTLKMFITVMYFLGHGGFYSLWIMMYYNMVIKQKLVIIKSKIKIRTNNFMKSADSLGNSPTSSPNNRTVPMTKASKFAKNK